jgi:hypothetical protein
MSSRRAAELTLLGMLDLLLAALDVALLLLVL